MHDEAAKHEEHIDAAGIEGRVAKLLEMREIHARHLAHLVLRMPKQHHAGSGEAQHLQARQVCEHGAQANAGAAVLPARAATWLRRTSS